MKFNWGTGIVIAFVLFISFIVFLVVKMNTNQIYQHDLVTEDYYKKELEYQEKIYNAASAVAMDYTIELSQHLDGLLVHFPEQLENAEVHGSVFMYRPSNKKLDFTTPIKLKHSKMLIPSEYLVEGRWNVEINWTYKNTPYYYISKLTLN